MKKFCEIKGFTQIEVSTNYCSLKSLLYEVNGIIYKYRQTYAFPALVDTAREELTAKFKEIADLEITSGKHSPPRKEILQYGRNIVKALSEHNRSFKYDNSCVDAVTTSAKYQVRSFLQVKDKMTLTEGMEIMKRNLLLNDTIKIVEKECGTKISIPSFNRLQDDMISHLKSKLDAYAFAA
jgi:hypothetical protein